MHWQSQCFNTQAGYALMESREMSAGSEMRSKSRTSLEKTEYQSRFDL
jgi:hypothetical protein